jgi:hypothetical protein
MGKSSKVKLRQSRLRYIQELGELIYAWNNMQELLAELFWVITGIPNGRIPLGVWHSTKSDRAQRDMLKAAALAAFAGESHEHQRIRCEICWLLERVNSLADRRNDVVHAPLWFVRDVVNPDQTKMIPHTFFGNPRAQKLVGKDLLEEFRWYRRMAEVLGSHALRLKFYLRGVEGSPWPDRPELPSRGQKSNHPNHSRPRRIK